MIEIASKVQIFNWGLGHGGGAHRDDAARSTAVLPEPSGATVLDRNRFPASEGLPSPSSLHHILVRHGFCKGLGLTFQKHRARQKVLPPSEGLPSPSSLHYILVRHEYYEGLGFRDTLDTHAINERAHDVK